MSHEPSSPTTVVHLLRHGEVENPTKILYGRLDGFLLSARGREMADVVSAYLATHDLVHLVSSPLERAQETAAPIAAVHGLDVTIDPRVIEAANYFQGQSFGAGYGAIAHPQHWAKLVNPFRPSWGEPYKDIAARVLAAIDDAREAALGHEALIVTHQLPIWTVRCALEGRRLWHDPRHRKCTLASLTSFTYVGTRLAAVGYCEPAQHLLAGAAPGAGA